MTDGLQDTSPRNDMRVIAERDESGNYAPPGRVIAGTEGRAIRFTCELARTQTMADGSPRITLNLPESGLDAMNELAKAKLAGAVFEVAIVAILPALQNKKQDQSGKIPTRSEWKP
jgi:hypothetical protein